MPKPHAHNDKPVVPRQADLKLARRVAWGDREAVATLCEQLADPLYRFVYYRLDGRVHETEEVVQETMLSVLKAIKSYRGESTLFTWSCAIAKRHVAKSRRQRSRARLAGVLEEMEGTIDRLLLQIDELPLPDEVLELEETQDIVGATLATLPLHYQQVLADKYVSSEPVQEIARKRGLSAKAVESTLTRARLAFRHTFKLLTQRLAEGRSE